MRRLLPAPLLHPIIHLLSLLLHLLLLFLPSFSAYTPPAPPHQSNLLTLLSHPHLSSHLTPAQHSARPHTSIHLRINPRLIHTQQPHLRQQQLTSLSHLHSHQPPLSPHHFHPLSPTSPSPSPSNLTLYLLHLKSPITPSSLHRLSSHLSPHSPFPLSFATLIPHSSLILLAPSTPSFASSLLDAPSLLLIDLLTPSDKHPPSLLTSPTPLDWIVHLYHPLPSPAPLSSLITAALALHLALTITPLPPHYLHIHLALSSSASPPSSLPSALLSLLTSSPYVVLILPHHPPSSLQNRFVHTILDPPPPPSTSPSPSSSSSSYTVLHNLTGAGQVIAHSDTGVDWTSCYFADPATPVLFNQLMPTHRKLLLYSTMGREVTPLTPDGDELEGHGTHTAGSLAGQWLTAAMAGNGSAKEGEEEEWLASFDGLAKAARLAVYDFAAQGVLVVPSDIIASYYEPLHLHTPGPHAAISSNSWGSPTGDYDHYCLDTDRFAHAHPTFLALFAAGNYGEEGFHSISSPGIAKNVLTVGSSQSSRASFRVLGRAAGVRVDGVDWPVTPAAFGPPYAQLNFTAAARVVIAHPPDGCAFNLSDPSYPLLSGAVVLVHRSLACYFIDKAHHLQRAGAVLMLVAQFEGHPLVVMAPNGGGGEATNVSIPAVMVTHDLAMYLSTHPAASVAYPLRDLDATQGEDVLSSFSSRGPTYDGRLKPDVVAPGEYVISARSAGPPNVSASAPFSCPTEQAQALVSLEGTSMATPAVAAAAALVREWCMRGEYERVGEDAGQRFEPTSALVKALLVHGGQSVGGKVTSRGKGSRGWSAVEDVVAAPSAYQGYGRVHLPSSLRFSSDPSWLSKSLTLADAGLDASRRPYPSGYQPARIAYEGELHHRCFRVVTPPAGLVQAVDFRATLVWTDPPPSVLTSHFLVNDLDLVVVRREGVAEEAGVGEVWIGNAGYNAWRVEGGEEQTTQWDAINNVEQVTVATDAWVEGDTVAVHVRGTRLHPGYGAQAYALAVTGPVVEVDMGECASPLICPHNCTGRGACVKGVCVCEFPYVSYDCGLQAEPLLFDALTVVWSITGRVDSEGFAWYYFTLPAQLTTGLQLTVERVGLAGDPDVYLSYNQWPTLLSHDYANTQCDSCPGTISSPLYLPRSSLPGSYRVLLHAYCCEAATYVVVVSGHEEEPVVEWAWKLPIGGCVLFAAVAVGVWALLWALRRREWVKERREGMLRVTRAGPVGRLQGQDDLAGLSQPLREQHPPPLTVVQWS